MHRSMSGYLWSASANISEFLEPVERQVKQIKPYKGNLLHVRKEVDGK